MKILLSCLFITLLSCMSNQKVDSLKLTKDFYQKAKSKEKEIAVFFNVTAHARGLDPVDSTYRINRIQVRLNDTLDVILPGIKASMKDEDITQLPFYENIEIFANFYKLTREQGIDSVKALSISVINLMNELKAFKVVGNPHGNGKFIIFSITDDYDVIYVPDTSDVKHKYWKTFFSTNNKFDDHWYYRKNKVTE